MPRYVRIRLAGTSIDDINRVCEDIKNVVRRAGVKMRGPIPLPTEKLRVTVRKAPSGQGTHTFDHWEMRIHKRLIDIDIDERALRQLMRIRVPRTVRVEIKII
ncbi:MAG: 30S ribosomal protein S10 [Thermoprotei archaeon]|nr:MAG: 30S ribosomal protein S10 [Thermoprotei archaeon]HDJ97291.1 30S ribosomal protein S10 [Thermofilum sp.]